VWKIDIKRSLKRSCGGAWGKGSPNVLLPKYTWGKSIALIPRPDFSHCWAGLPYLFRRVGAIFCPTTFIWVSMSTHINHEHRCLIILSKKAIAEHCITEKWGLNLKFIIVMSKILYFYDRTVVRIGIEIDLLRLFASAFPRVCHSEIFCAHPCAPWDGNIMGTIGAEHIHGPQSSCTTRTDNYPVKECVLSEDRCILPNILR